MLAMNDEEKMAWLGGAEELRPEPRGFSPEQMVRCEECLRANPPTRAVCLYCAAPLPLTEAGAQLRQPLHRKLEDWQTGVNLILLPEGLAAAHQERTKELAEVLRLHSDELLRILEAKAPLPVARTATPDDASLIEGRLRALGASALIISDQELALEEAAPQRLRALEFKADALVALPVGSSEGISIPWAEIVLLVAGRLFEKRVEVEERRGRGSSENEIVEARELSADEAVLDIYAKALEGNFRIVSNNFDFSCLGAEKKLIAAENFLRLGEVLRTRAADALYDDLYARVRHALGPVWPLEERTGSGGLRRARPGRVNTETVTRTDNEKQFTRYSRLQHYLRTQHSTPLA